MSNQLCSASVQPFQTPWPHRFSWLLSRLLLRRGLLVVAGLFLGTAGLVAAEDRGVSEQLPNFVLLMGDDHGWDETGYNGHPHLHTPVLDEMAATGLKLDRFYAAHPSCSPTRGSVMTGRHPNRYGTFAPGFSFRPEETSIAQLLSQAGYVCGHFGKWHLGPVKASSPTNPGAMGFHQWLSHDNFFELDPWFSRNGGPPQQYQGESSQIIIEEAIRFVDQAKQDGKPFFVVVWFGSPHEPYSGLEKDLALYEDLPTAYADKRVRLTSNETGRPVQRPLDEVLQARYAEITAMDRSIGHLRTWLSANELRDNTMLWYCGDNGTPGDGIVTSPFRGQKGTHYEGGVRVPGVIQWPARIKSPRSSQVNTVTSDILPTICDWAGIDSPDRPLDGISLESLLSGEMQQRPEPIYFWSFDLSGLGQREPYIEPELQQGTTPLVKLMGGLPTRNFRNFRFPETGPQDRRGTRVVLGNRFKLIVRGDIARGDNEQPEMQLFDVRSDPAEERNVLELYPEIAQQLEQQLRQWQESVLASLSGADY